MKPHHRFLFWMFACLSVFPGAILYAAEKKADTTSSEFDRWIVENCTGSGTILFDGETYLVTKDVILIPGDKVTLGEEDTITLTNSRTCEGSYIGGPAEFEVKFDHLEFIAGEITDTYEEDPVYVRKYLRIHQPSPRKEVNEEGGIIADWLFYHGDIQVPDSFDRPVHKLYYRDRDDLVVYVATKVSHQPGDTIAPVYLGVILMGSGDDPERDTKLTTTQQPTFKWEEVPSATSYKVTISTSHRDGGEEIFSDDTTDNTYSYFQDSPALDPGTCYTLVIFASDELGDNIATLCTDFRIAIGIQIRALTRLLSVFEDRGDRVRPELLGDVYRVLDFRFDAILFYETALIDDPDNPFLSSRIDDLYRSIYGS